VNTEFTLQETNRNGELLETVFEERIFGTERHELREWRKLEIPEKYLDIGRGN
jgi:hypothetical protein